MRVPVRIVNRSAFLTSDVRSVFVRCWRMKEPHVPDARPVTVVLRPKRRNSGVLGRAILGGRTMWIHQEVEPPPRAAERRRVMIRTYVIEYADGMEQLVDAHDLAGAAGQATHGAPIDRVREDRPRRPMHVPAGANEPVGYVRCLPAGNVHPAASTCVEADAWTECQPCGSITFTESVGGRRRCARCGRLK